MGKNRGTNVMIVIDRVLYNVVCGITFRAGLDTRLHNDNKGIRRVKTYMNECCNEERYFTYNKNNAMLVKTVVNETRYIALRVLLLIGREYYVTTLNIGDTRMKLSMS